MSCCNNNCNHDPCGSSFNQAVTKAAQYAQYAQTQANKAEDLWEEFNALYLGAFAVAPTQDNEGNPLQVGALYWNSVTTDLWVWDGTSWIPDAFNEFTPFLATGTTTARNLVTRFADVVNVKDYGAVGNNLADDTFAIQNAINLNPGKAIYFPKGIYRIYNTITINSGQTSIISDFNGCAEIVMMNDVPAAAIEIKSSTPGNSIYKNIILNMVFRRPASATYQIGLSLERTQDFSISNSELYGFPTNIDIKGGYNCTYSNLRLGSFLSTNADAGKGVVQIKAASFPPSFDGYTHLFTGCQIGGNTTEYAIVFRGNDYASFSNCYIASGKKGGVLIEADSTSPFGNYNNNFDNCYFDRVSMAGSNIIAVNINDQTTPPPQNSTQSKYSDCVFGGWDTAIRINKSFDPVIEIIGCRFYDQTGAAIEATGNFTNLVIGNNQFHNNTATTSGNATINILDIHSVSITGNIFSYIELFPFPGTRDAIRLAGTIDAATITGNAINRFNAANVTDFANTATISRLVVTGNASDNPNNTIVGHLIGNQANSNSLMLDWYEEKTFTPSLSFGGSSTGITYSQQNGTATRIGDRVFFDLYFQLSSKGSATGNASISGLPYNYSGAPCCFTINAGGLDPTIGGTNIDAQRILPNSIQPNKQVSGSTLAMNDADFTNTTFLTITGTYVAQ